MTFTFLDPHNRHCRLFHQSYKECMCPLIDHIVGFLDWGLNPRTWSGGQARCGHLTFILFASLVIKTPWKTCWEHVIILLMWKGLLINTTLDKVGPILCNLIPCGKTEGIFQMRVLHICSFVLGLPLAGYIAHTGDADDSDGFAPSSIPPFLLYTRYLSGGKILFLQ